MKTEVRFNPIDSPYLYDLTILSKVEETTNGTRYEVFNVQNFGYSNRFMVFRVNQTIRKRFIFFGADCKTKTYELVKIFDTEYRVDDYIGRTNLYEQEFIINTEQLQDVASIYD